MSTNQLTVKQYFENDKVKSKLSEILGKKSAGFTTSVLQVISNNALLSKAEPSSVYNAAMTAAILDLPINNNLGFAYIVPYKAKVNNSFVDVAQFQIGYKGLVQLAQRTGQYKRLNVVEVYQNQFISFDTLSEDLNCNFTIKGEGEPIGYAAFMRLLNGFEKCVYWTREQCEAHGKKYSKTYSNQNSTWSTNFDGMAKKTVLKSMLSKWGILSIEMQQVIESDQAVIAGENGENLSYEDHGEALTVMDDETFNEALIEVAAGNATTDSIMTTYSITEDQENQLRNAEPKN